MKINIIVNSEPLSVDCAPNETLLHWLRRNGYFGVKHGCENGECGACAVLLDGRPIPSCMILTAQAEGKHITTIEALGEIQDQGWKKTEGLHLLQE
ncbi:MAG TPA: 2Fe-2S iron-sulfur cluster-binding protein, partial [Anaerolineae bacterium]